MATSNNRIVADQKQGCNRAESMVGLNTENIKLNGKKGFLDLPLEVRMMVYDIFFGAQVFPIGLPGTQSGGPNADNPAVSRATAHHKLSLLLTNRAIWVEASPFFYRLHLFYIRLLNTHQFPLPPCHRILVGVHQGFQGIQHVELTYQNPDLDSAQDDNVSTYLRLLRLGCPALKSLRIEHAHFVCFCSPEKESVGELQQLWPRLDSLQVCIEHWEDVPDTMLGGDFIAPGGQWHRQVCENLWGDAAHQGRRRALKRTVYSVTRYQKADEIG